jgi:hypothetical protein
MRHKTKKSHSHVNPRASILIQDYNTLEVLNEYILKLTGNKVEVTKWNLELKFEIKSGTHMHDNTHRKLMLDHCYSIKTYKDMNIT